MIECALALLWHVLPQSPAEQLSQSQSHDLSSWIPSCSISPVTIWWFQISLTFWNPFSLTGRANKNLPVLWNPFPHLPELCNLSWYSSASSWLYHSSRSQSVNGTKLNSLLLTSAIQNSAEAEHFPRKHISSAIASIPLRNKSLPITTLCLFLVFPVVIWGAEGATFLSSSVTPDVTGLFSSVCRAEKQFYKGISGLGGILFLL